MCYMNILITKSILTIIIIRNVTSNGSLTFIYLFAKPIKQRRLKTDVFEMITLDHI